MSDSEECTRCGRRWHPSMDASETFPGSRCDLGECECIYCGEDGCDYDCPRARRKEAQRAEAHRRGVP